MNISRKQIYLCIIIILSVVSIAYYFYQGTSVKMEDIPKAEKSQPVTKTIWIGTIGDDAFKETQLFQPTANYIAARLSDNQTVYKGEVIIAKNFETISNISKEQKLDIYIDSPFPSIIVARKSGMVPFLRRWKDGVEQYHTVFIVKNNSSIRSITDFKGKTVASEDESSTTSYLMPKAYFIQNGFIVDQTQENSIKFVFTGGKENTPLWVIEGKADIGAMSNLEFDKIPPNIRYGLRVIERTIDLPRHIVSHSPDMEPAMIENVQKIFIDMDKDAKGIEILKNFQNTKKYDPISMDVINNISHIIDLLEIK